MDAADPPVGLIAAGGRGGRMRQGLRLRGVPAPRVLSLAEALAEPRVLESLHTLVVDVAGLADNEDGLVTRLLSLWSGAMIFADAEVIDEQVLDRLAFKIQACAHRAGSPSVRPRSGVCLLAASTGGPPALRRFLAALNGPPRTAILIAQHIGAGFAGILARQLAGAAGFPVDEAAEGTRLRAGRAWVYPVADRLVVGSGDVLHHGGEWPPGTRHEPCIDAIASQLVTRFAARTAMLVFTGMGRDGAAGAAAVAAAGGAVWAESQASAELVSMPDAAAERAVLRGRGTPEALALEYETWAAGAPGSARINEQEGSA